MLVRHLPLAWAKVDNGADVVSSSYQARGSGPRPHARWSFPHLSGRPARGPHPGQRWLLVAHDLVAELDWDASLEGQMLLPIWGELMLAGRRFDQVTEPTWLYRRHGANISAAALSRTISGGAEARERLRQRAVAVLGSVPGVPVCRPGRKSARADRNRRLTRRVVRRLRAGLARRLSP